MTTNVVAITGLLTFAIPEPFTVTDEDLWGTQLNTIITDLGAYIMSPYLEVNAIGNTGGDVAINYANGPIQTLTLTSNATDFTVSNLTKGAVLTLYVAQDGTGSRTFTDTAGNFNKQGGTAITLSTAASAKDKLTITAIDGTDVLLDIGGLAYAV